MSAENLYIFDGFSKEEIAYFLLMTQTQNRKKGEKVINMGESSNGCAYYIKSGHVKVVREGNEVALLGPGSFFGEIALITDEPRTATVEAIDDVVLQVFLKADFLALLKRSSHEKEMQKVIMQRIKDNMKH